jgi:hypothetical protein
MNESAFFAYELTGSAFFFTVGVRNFFNTADGGCWNFEQQEIAFSKNATLSIFFITRCRQIDF